jgi:hypothetical protein
MPDVNHSSLTDPYLHEPKGVAAAAAGDVYIADGAGSGSWSQAFQYASINTIETNAQTVSTIGTNPKTLPFTNNGPDNVEVSDAANNRITLTDAGVYFITFRVTFFTSAPGDAGLYEFKVLDDGVATGLALARQMSGSSDTGTAAIAGLMTAGAGSHITVSVESDDAGNNDDIGIYSSNLVAFKVG